DDLWAFTGEMYAVDDGERALIDAGVAIDPVALKSQWLKTVAGVIAEATLNLPKSDWMQQGGRVGRHSEHLGHLLSELQSLQRSFPGAPWGWRLRSAMRPCASGPGTRHRAWSIRKFRC